MIGIIVSVFRRVIGMTAALTALATPACEVLAADTDESLIRHVLSRLTYGPRPGDIARLKQTGLQAFIEEQLDPDRLDDSALEEQICRFDVLWSSPGELYRKYPQNNPNKKKAKTDQAAKRDGPKADAERRRKMANRYKPRIILDQLASAKVLRALYSHRQLYEIMVDFWFNHFNVFWNKGACKWLVPSFERDAIRPYALGNFRNLLGAVAHHPAMLFYLDNHMSAAPRKQKRGAMKNRKKKQRNPGMTDSMMQQAKQKPRAKRKWRRGLNENYGRELLELHTLGVDGGYTQKDVIEVARCFTGWTIDKMKGEPEFIFRPYWHDSKQKTVLGQTIPGSRTTREGEQVLDMLSRHPATARFIATKLCRRFIADDPPSRAIDRVAAAFHESDGDIRATLRALFGAPEFNAPEARRAKMKSPFEYLASALRGLDAEMKTSRPLLYTLHQMGQFPYTCAPPTGYPDTASSWISAGALLVRMKTAMALSYGWTKHIEVDLEKVAGCPLDGDSPEVAQRLWDRLVGGDMSESTQEVLMASVRWPNYPRLAALILGSPEFQRK